MVHHVLPQPRRLVEQGAARRADGGGAAPRSGAAARPAQPQPAQGTEQRGECGEDRGDRGEDRGEGFGGRVCGHGRSLVGGFASTRQVRARFMIVNEPPAPA